MAEPKIPDRSVEPALQKSLDHGPKATTAANSDDANHAAKPDTRAKNAPKGEKADDPSAPPDAEEVEELTGVPAAAKDLGIV